MRGLLLLLAVAACNDGIAIEVVVAPDSTATQVELFLGFGGPCKADLDMDGSDELCPGVGPPTDTPFAGRPVTMGQVFHVDDTKPFVANVDGGSAWFRVDAADLELPVVIAVGTGPSGPDSVAIARRLSIADSPQHIRIQLVDAGTGLTKVMVPAETNVEIWPDPTPDRAFDIDTCVGAELAGERVFIVPRSNPDCDSVAVADECNRFVFEAEEIAQAVPLEGSKCTFELELEIGGGLPVCRLGGQVCNEMQGGGIGCANDDVTCAPNHLCASCPRLDAQCVGDAFRTDLNPMLEVAHVKCDVQLELDSNQGKAKPCLGRSTAADFGGVCGTPRLSRLAYPFDFAEDPLKIDVGDGEIQFSADTPVLCGFILEHSGEIAFDTASESPPDLVMWTAFQTPTKTVLLPVLVHWVPVAINGCAVDSASACTFVPAPNDNVELCFDT